MKMFILSVYLVTAFVVSILIHGIPAAEYQDLENTEAFCTHLKDYYKCTGQASTYDEKGCKCDAACSEYLDCCMNSPDKKSSKRNQMVCLHVGEENIGIYAINTCPDNWVGPSEILDKCEGPTDLSDPLFSTPVTSFADSLTYRNHYCADCNDADMVNLKYLQLKLICPKLSPFLTEEQVFADLRYDKKLASWGIDRLNAFGNSTNFYTCDITFEIPDYFDAYVRLCPPNIISSCPPEYTDDHIRNACEEYMAVVYDDSQGYRNPHCAICNGKAIEDIHCEIKEESRRRQMSFALLLDINMSDGDQVGKKLVLTPKCPSNHKYDWFFKKCRKLVCVLPGFEIVNGKCVRQT